MARALHARLTGRHCSPLLLLARRLRRRRRRRRRGGARAAATARAGAGRSGRQGGDEQAAAPTSASRRSRRATRRASAAPTPIADAAGVAQAVFPRATRDTRPRAVALVDTADWRVAVSAAQLMAAPLRAPLLFSDGGELPGATEQALGRLIPTGAEEAGGAQVIRVGDGRGRRGLQDDRRSRAPTTPRSPQAIDRLQTAAAGKPSRGGRRRVVRAARLLDARRRLGGEVGRPGAVGHARRDPGRRRAPRSRAHKRPRIYVLGPESAVSKKVLEQLGELGDGAPGRRPPTRSRTRSRSRASPTARSAGTSSTPATGSCSPTRSARSTPRRPRRCRRPGPTGRCCCSPTANALPAPLQDYLLDIQPGYDADPVRGVYNHGWMIGDEAAISVDVQARIDTLLEIQPVDAAAARRLPRHGRSRAARAPAPRAPRHRRGRAPADGRLDARTSRSSCATGSAS